MSGAPVSYLVDLDELRTTITDLTGLEQTVQTQLDQLAQVMSHLHESWSGTAASAQRTAHAAWVQAAADMHAALTRMREAGEHAHGQYTGAAEANVEMWQQLG